MEPADSPTRHAWSFITASAFQGKSKGGYSRRLDPATALPPDSPIRQWHDTTIRDHVSSAGGRATGGHDWWFVQPMKDNQGLALGVADGVGVWADEGIDPGSVAKGLMYFSHQLAQQGYASEPSSTNDDGHDQITATNTPTKTETRVLMPKVILSEAWSNVMSCNDIHGGSTTALIATLCSKTGLLRYASLGDSQVLVIRRSEVLYTSRPQSHCFNCPYQLTKFPGREQTSEEIHDDPTKAIHDDWPCQDGDVVVLWTDGVGDNLFSWRVLLVYTSIMDSKDNEHLSESDKVEKFALKLCSEAELISRSPWIATPFGQEAQEHGRQISGGKLDDITVVVVLCRKTEE